MTITPLLLPQPQQVWMREGSFHLPASRRIAGPAGLESLALRLGADWRLVAADSPAELSVKLQPELTPREQSYRLRVSEEGITITAADLPGAYYGACTLAQLIQQYDSELPTLDIYDWPDYPVRGVMLDISRDKVYKPEVLRELIDRLAGWKINQLQFYMEHTFAYSQHREVWENASPLDAAEVQALDAFCKERFIELVPNQNTFGHMERWLKHERYAELAETFDWFDTPYGKQEGPFSLQPDHPGSLELVSGLFDELLPNFSSGMANIGCDETFDVGQGKTRQRVEAEGLGKVYLEYLLKVYQNVAGRGKVVQFWGDIITQEPHLVPLLPRDAIALLWGYEAEHPFEAQAQQFAAAGMPFYVCPGTSSWTSLGGRTDNCLENIRSAAAAGLKHGAIGLLNTDWGDRGHWQHLPISWLGLAAGAGMSWSLEHNPAENAAMQTGLFAYEDPSGSMGRLAAEMGNVYQATGLPVPNGSALFWLLQLPAEMIAGFVQFLSPAVLGNVRAAIDTAMSHLKDEQMRRPDAALIRREWLNTARMMHHAVSRADLLANPNKESQAKLLADLQELLTEYRAIWLERNRPGGLEDSVARFIEMSEAHA